MMESKKLSSGRLRPLVHIGRHLDQNWSSRSRQVTKKPREAWQDVPSTASLPKQVPLVNRSKDDQRHRPAWSKMEFLKQWRKGEKKFIRQMIGGQCISFLHLTVHSLSRQQEQIVSNIGVKWPVGKRNGPWGRNLFLSAVVHWCF